MRVGGQTRARVHPVLTGAVRVRTYEQVGPEHAKPFTTGGNGSTRRIHAGPATSDNCILVTYLD
jgi:hypothetical protein